MEVFLLSKPQDIAERGTIWQNDDGKRDYAHYMGITLRYGGDGDFHVPLGRESCLFAAATAEGELA